MHIPNLQPIVLADDERRTLEGWARRRNIAASRVQRARIVLACADGWTIGQVAERVGCGRSTVTKWRGRFLSERLKGLDDEPRPGRPKAATDEQVESLIGRTLLSRPANDDLRWSTRTMAKASGMSQSVVSRIWREFGLKPSVVEQCKVSTDLDFVAKVRDIVGLYVSPHEKVLAFVVSEESQLQSIGLIARTSPMKANTSVRLPQQNHQHGMTPLAALGDPLSWVMANRYRRRTHTEFHLFLKVVDEAVPQGLAVGLVLDEPAAHQTLTVSERMVMHPRFRLHTLPIGSWPQHFECCFAELAERELKCAANDPISDLKCEINRWANGRNLASKTLIWTKTAEEVLETLTAYCVRINDSKS